VTVVTVEEPPFLSAMQRIVGGIEIEPDDRRRFRVSLKEAIHQETVHALGIGDDLLVSGLGVGILEREFQAIECAGAGQGLALVMRRETVLSARVGFSDHRSQ